jgi:hypothetical protein
MNDGQENLLASAPSTRLRLRVRDGRIVPPSPTVKAAKPTQQGCDGCALSGNDCYCSGRGIWTTSHQISFEFLFVKNCPQTIVRIWFGFFTELKDGIRTYFGHFWPKGIKQKFGGKWFLSPGRYSSGITSFCIWMMTSFLVPFFWLALSCHSKMHWLDA